MLLVQITRTLHVAYSTAQLIQNMALNFNVRYRWQLSIILLISEAIKLFHDLCEERISNLPPVKAKAEEI